MAAEVRESASRAAAAVARGCGADAQSASASGGREYRLRLWPGERGGRLSGANQNRPSDRTAKQDSPESTQACFPTTIHLVRLDARLDDRLELVAAPSVLDPAAPNPADWPVGPFGWRETPAFAAPALAPPSEPRA